MTPRRAPALLVLAALAACGDNAAGTVDAGVPPDAGQPFFLAPVSYPATHAASAVAVGDVDGDGLLDLVVVGGDQVGSVAVLRGTGGGAFGTATVFTEGKMPSAVVAADFDGDGRADVAMVDVGTGTAMVAHAGAGGILGGWTSYRLDGGWPLSVAAADLNADGHLDLPVATNLAGGVSILLGDGALGFALQPYLDAGSYPMEVRVADLDRDGIPDLAVADQGPLEGDSTAAVLRGRGDGTFAAPALFEVGNFPDAIAVGDLNGDGLPDLVVSNQLENDTSVLLATGGGAFAPQQRYPFVGSALAIGDLDGDGHPEILIGGGQLHVMHNAGDGTFDMTWTVACGCSRMAIADLNGDGKPDIANVAIDPNGATWGSPDDHVRVFLHAP